MDLEFRLLKKEELSFLEEMLYEALFVPPDKPKFPKSIINEPATRKYIKNWNEQENDIAIVVTNKNELLGVIWGRTFNEENKGFGYVSEQIPEISMAVKPKFRNKGIGKRLLIEIEAKYNLAGIKALSLSVDKLNPAIKLYERNGYSFFEDAGTAITMLKEIT